MRNSRGKLRARHNFSFAHTLRAHYSITFTHLSDYSAPCQAYGFGIDAHNDLNGYPKRKKRNDIVLVTAEYSRFTHCKDVTRESRRLMQSITESTGLRNFQWPKRRNDFFSSNFNSDLAYANPKMMAMYGRV